MYVRVEAHVKAREHFGGCHSPGWRVPPPLLPLPPLYLSSSLSHWEGDTDFLTCVRLGGLRVLGICTSLLPPHWNYMCAPPHPAFQFWRSNSGP